MSKYRAEAIAYAVVLSITGLAVAAGIAVRTIAAAIDAATTYPPQPAHEAFPNTVPLWMDEEADLP